MKNPDRPIIRRSAREIAIRKEKLLKMLEKHRGLIYMACKSACVDPSTYYDYLAKDPEFAKKVDAIKEGVLDWAESKLQGSMEIGEYIPTMFYLKCKGKGRGYIEKQEIKLSGDPDNPLVPNSIVQSVLQAALQAEHDRLAALPPDAT